MESQSRSDTYAQNENINVRCEYDPTLSGTEIIIRSPYKNDETKAIAEKINQLVNKKICVSDSNGVNCFLTENDILIIAAKGKYVQITARNGLYTAKQSLKNIEQTLSRERFLKISRYEIINTDKIVKFDFTVGGTLRIDLCTGTQVWASRRYIPIIRKHLLGEKEENL